MEVVIDLGDDALSVLVDLGVGGGVGGSDVIKLWEWEDAAAAVEGFCVEHGIRGEDCQSIYDAFVFDAQARHVGRLRRMWEGGGGGWLELW